MPDNGTRTIKDAAAAWAWECIPEPLDVADFDDDTHGALVDALALDLARAEGVDLGSLLAILAMVDDLDTEVVDAALTQLADAADAVIENYRERAREHLENR